MDPITKALSQSKSTTFEQSGGQNQSVRGWLNPERKGDQSSEIAIPEGIVLEPNLEAMAANHVLKDVEQDTRMGLDRYRLLRTRVLSTMTARKYQSLGITSAGPRAGKTLTSINLGMTIARDQRKEVIIVDADLRRPSIAGTLGIEIEGGITDFLSGAAELEEVTYRLEGFPGLRIIAGHDTTDQNVAPDLLQSERMRLLERSLFDPAGATIAIYDLPPVLVGDDAIAVTSNLDAALLVIEHGGTTIEELKQAKSLLRDVDLIGSVLNKSTETPHEYGRYYGDA